MSELEQLRKDNLERHRECGRLRLKVQRLTLALQDSIEVLDYAWQASPGRLSSNAGRVIERAQKLLNEVA